MSRDEDKNPFKDTGQIFRYGNIDNTTNQIFKYILHKIDARSGGDRCCTGATRNGMQ
jgi:hypothetical protein